MHYLLFYEYVPNYLERRNEFRDAHLSLVRAAMDRDELFLGGAFANPADGAVIVFKGNSPEVAKAFAEADPYVRNGLVTAWRVREWTTVVGRDAAQPLEGFC
jgi:uncharacterized protein